MIDAFDDDPDTSPDDKTPVGPPGSCWRCERIDAVFIVAPAPASIHEAIRLPTCIATKKWAYCAVKLIVRLGEFDLYVGPERRMSPRPVTADRRRLPPVPPRADDT